MDAWAIWSPFLGELLASGEARSLVDGRGLVDNAVHYIASPEFVETHPTLAELFFSQLAGIATSIAPHRVPRRIDETLIQAQQRVADTFYRHKLIPTEVQLQMSFWRPPQKYEALWQLFGKEETA